LINTTLKAKLIERGIPELGPIFTANSFQAVGCSLFNLKAKLRKCSNTSSLLSKKKPPRVMRIVINNDKNIPLASDGVNPRGTDSVHME
jgi:hypothetical protein